MSINKFFCAMEVKSTEVKGQLRFWAVADQMHKLNKCSNKQATDPNREPNWEHGRWNENGENRTQIKGKRKRELDLCGIDVDDTGGLDTGQGMPKAHDTQVSITIYT